MPFISFEEEQILFNNKQLFNNLDFALQVANKQARESEMKHVKALETWFENSYFNGTDVDIEAVLPELDKKKFWKAVFFETAQTIFERKIGNHDSLDWQTTRIHQLYATAILFQKAVREEER